MSDLSVDSQGLVMGIVGHKAEAMAVGVLLGTSGVRGGERAGRTLPITVKILPRVGLRGSSVIEIE